MIPQEPVIDDPTDLPTQIPQTEIINDPDLPPGTLVDDVSDAVGDAPDVTD